MQEYMKTPCLQCPFRKDVKPFLHPARGEKLALHTENPYNSFPCHKTTVFDEESEDGGMIRTERSLECAGFITMQLQCSGEGYKPEGFEPAYGVVYEDAWEMINAYEK